ncbi:MAG: ATP-binding protein, partial [Syntrophobacterales bacterium]
HDVEKVLKISSKKEKDQVVVNISDTGLGMSEEVKEKIFEPFYTTKPVGKGTGLGLSISFGIVRDYDGTIDVESVEGRGTTFTIRFPVAEEEGQEILEVAGG